MSEPIGVLALSLIATLSAQVPGGAAASAPAAAAASRVREDMSGLATEGAEVASWTTRLVTEWSLKLLGVVLVLAGAWIVAAWARRALYRVLNRPHFDQTLIRFISNLARWAILLIGFVACLTLFGIAPASLAAVVGAAGLAIGLALQGSLSNLAAGIMLLLLRPFKVGDAILVAGQIGTVDDIELFNTKIDTLENRRLIIPNSQIFGAVIENITHHPRRCIVFVIGVEYAADVDRTRQVLEEVVRSVPGRLDEPAPMVVLNNLGANSVEWQLRVWAPSSDFLAVRQALIRSVKYGLDQAGIGIPFPQMDVWMRSREGAPKAAGARALAPDQPL